MIAAIAIIGGYNVKDYRVKTLVYSGLVANSAKEVLKNIGIQITKNLPLMASLVLQSKNKSIAVL